MTTTAWLILWIPFFSAVLIAGFLLKRPKIAGGLATLAMLTAFALTCTLLYKFSQTGWDKSPYESAITWIPLESFSIEFGILLNSMTLLMLGIVTGVGTLIFLYSTSYMENDESFARYFASLSLFVFSMLGIVLSNNLIQTFIFWELVGLSSYLLIGFWYQKPAASTASKKAFLTTRVGDVGMMIGILLLFGFLASAGKPTFNFLQIEDNLAAASIPAATMTVIAFGLFMGVMGKSAQMPLHVWLPDAMEGPTPVSALIHAATMVAAGVFLLARLFFIFEASPTAMHVISWVGGITAILAGSIAIVQNDIKKILAYSTLSQLGYMVMALGLGNPQAGMFHLTTHAFFKALLFLGAGSFIHAMHTQDIWEMPQPSGLLKKMPITTATFLIGTFALMGIPPLSGYFSKEEILSAAFNGSKILFGISAANVLVTSFYMGRLCTVAFFRPADPHSHGHAHGRNPMIPAHSGRSETTLCVESNWKMTLPLVLLSILAAISGFLPIKNLLPPVHGHSHHEGAQFIQILSLTLALAGFVLSFLLYRGKKKPGTVAGSPLVVLEKKYFFDDFYDVVVIKLIQENAAKFLDFFERIVVVEAGVNGTARFTRSIGDMLRRLQTGVVQFYALVFTAGVTLIVYLFILAGKS